MLLQLLSCLLPHSCAVLLSQSQHMDEELWLAETLAHPLVVDISNGYCAGLHALVKTVHQNAQC